MKTKKNQQRLPMLFVIAIVQNISSTHSVINCVCTCKFIPPQGHVVVLCDLMSDFFLSQYIHSHCFNIMTHILVCCQW